MREWAERKNAPVRSLSSLPASAPPEEAAMAVRSAVANERTTGLDIDAGMMERLESSFGPVASRVRFVESDLPAKLGAKAVAQGDLVRLAPGAYRPGTRSGQQLLSHELGHVVQQSRGSAMGMDAGMPLLDQSLESGADAIAGRAMAGESLNISAAPAPAASAPMLGAGFFKKIGNWFKNLFHWGRRGRNTDAAPAQESAAAPTQAPQPAADVLPDEQVPLQTPEAPALSPEAPVPSPESPATAAEEPSSETEPPAPEPEEGEPPLNDEDNGILETLVEDDGSSESGESEEIPTGGASQQPDPEIKEVLDDAGPDSGALDVNDPEIKSDEESRSGESSESSESSESGEEAGPAPDPRDLSQLPPDVRHQKELERMVALRPWKISKQAIQNNAANPLNDFMLGKDVDTINDGVAGEADNASKVRKLEKNFGKLLASGVMKGSLGDKIDATGVQDRMLNMTRMLNDFPELRKTLTTMSNQIHHVDDNGIVTKSDAAMSASIAPLLGGEGVINWNENQAATRGHFEPRKTPLDFDDKRRKEDADRRERNDFWYSNELAKHLILISSDAAYAGNHELGHLVNFMMINRAHNNDKDRQIDATRGDTNNKLIEESLNHLAKRELEGKAVVPRDEGEAEPRTINNYLKSFGKKQKTKDGKVEYKFSLGEDYKTNPMEKMDDFKLALQACKTILREKRNDIKGEVAEYENDLKENARFDKAYKENLEFAKKHKIQLPEEMLEKPLTAPVPERPKVIVRGHKEEQADKVTRTKRNYLVYARLTSRYGATNPTEMIAEAFGDVYQNGKEASMLSKQIVKRMWRRMNPEAAAMEAAMKRNASNNP